MHKIGQSGGLSGRLYLKLVCLYALKPLTKIVSIPLGLTAAASATDDDIHKKIFWIGYDMNDIMKIVKSIKDADL